MLRKTIIVTTLLGLLIGTIGLPMNVHACKMAKEEKVAQTCGMCSSDHAKQGDEKRGCCENRLELQHTDDASLANTGISIAPPVLLAVLVWHLSSLKTPVESYAIVTSHAHSPPLERRGQSTYLFNSSFLI